MIYNNLSMRKKRKAKSKQRRRLKNFLGYFAWITLTIAIVVGIYWFAIGRDRYAVTCFSNGEAAMNAGIYVDANRSYLNAMQNAQDGFTMRNAVKSRYLTHLQFLIDARQYAQAQRVYGFIQTLFPEDPEVQRQGATLQVLLMPTEHLAIASRKLFAGYQGHYLKDGSLLATDIMGTHWLFDPAHLASKRVFQIPNDQTLLAIAPTGGKAAVFSKGALSFLNPDGSQFSKVSIALGQDAICSWSPDESQLVTETPSGRLMILDSLSGEIKPFSHGTWPSWSPLGDRIAYVASGSLVVESPQGGSLERLVKLGQGLVARPLWSPRGDRLAIISSSLQVLDLTGRKLFSQPGDDCLPAWSPSGDKLLVARIGKPLIKVFDFKRGVNELKLELPVISCEWSPSGTEILVNCQSDEGQEQAMYLLSLGKANSLKTPSPNAF